MEDKISIENVEDFRGEKDLNFSHQALVMKAMNKCLELGSRELKEAYIDPTSTHPISLNQKGKPVNSEDTRRTFIEGVRSCEMTMICDYDSTAIEKINAIHKKQKDKREDLLKQQWEIYSKYNWKFKQDHPTVEEYFNMEFPFYNFYLESMVDLCREIFQELTLLTKRIGFYEEADIKG